MKSNLLKITHLFSSLGYSLVQITQGLFFHPYQTMQLLFTKKTFSFLVFMPMLLLTLAKLIFIILGSFQLFPNLVMVKNLCWYWVKYFCLLWQLVLGYLFIRFWYAWRPRQSTN